ncbi:MAG: response regulator, partial [Clostridiales bacterium]|nr:response regulator [Clostridiales bacterium]
MSAPGTAQNESSEQASSRPGLPGVRILIAEDIAVNAEIILAILEGTGATGAVAQNGRAAVDMFAADPTYDLILMDLQMPVMDGFAATRAIRALAHPAALRVPVIAVSANVFKDDIRACMDAGMNDHIPKPVDEALFFSTVSKYVTVTAPKAAKTAATGGAYDAYLPDINVADGLKRLCGNKKLYAKLLTHFRDYIGLNGLNAALAAE